MLYRASPAVCHHPLGSAFPWDHYRAMEAAGRAGHPPWGWHPPWGAGTCCRAGWHRTNPCCVHVHTCTHTHTHAHVCMHKPMQMHAHTHAHEHTHICAHACTYMSAHTHACTYTCMCPRTHATALTRTQLRAPGCKHAHMHAHTHAHRHTPSHVHRHTRACIPAPKCALHPPRCCQGQH